MPTNLSGIYFTTRALLFGILAALALGWAAMKLSWRIGLVDRPNSAPHKLHSQPIAMGGGIALFAALWIGSLVLDTFNNNLVKATLIAGSLIFIFGLLDDYRALAPIYKLGGQVLAVAILIYFGVSVQIFESPDFFFHGEGPVFIVLDWLVTLFWVVGITNAFNFVDSMDGLAVGLGAMSAAFFLLLTLESQQYSLSLYSALIFGACLGLYFFNSQPAMLFLGDSGAQTLGFMLAALAIAYRPQGTYQSSSWFVPIFLLGVPIFDTLLIILSRLRRGLPIYVANRDHTYHRLVNLLRSPNRAVLVMQVGALVLGCVAILGLNQPPAAANAIFVGVVLLGAALLLILEKRGLSH